MWQQRNDKTTSNKDTGKQTKGGAMTVLAESGYQGAWPAGLDPATNTNGAANLSYMNSIYGQLFQLGAGGKIIPDLAAGSQISDNGKTVKIMIRPGVKFSDGSPFDAKTVQWNIQRDLKSECTCRPTWPVKSVTTEGDSTVVLNFTAAYAPIINSFIDSNANWIASKTALDKMGERAFRIKPVGAGPFKVVSNKLSSELVLERNPTYCKKGRPFLDKLTFKSIGGDEAAFQALQAGQAQAYEDMATPSLVDQAKKNPKFTVTQQLSTSPYNIQLNTAIKPFNDIKAREAIYYATDSESIRSKLFQNRYPSTQSFTGPGGPLLPAGGAGLQDLRPREGQGAREGARRPAGRARHDQRARRQADHPGAAEPVGAGGHQGDAEVLRPGAADRAVPVEEVAGDVPDGRVLRPGGGRRRRLPLLVDVAVQRHPRSRSSTRCWARPPARSTRASARRSTATWPST